MIPGLNDGGAGRGRSLFYSADRYHYDGLGSVVAISDANGEIVERYEYDVFGRSIVHTGAGADGVWMNRRRYNRQQVRTRQSVYVYRKKI